MMRHSIDFPSSKVMVAVALAALLGACHFGTRPENYGPALGPEGATVAVRVINEISDRVGELYAVDALGITIAAPQVTRIAWTKIEAMDVARLGSEFDVRHGEVVSADKATRLALVSRFPQGLDGAVLQQVLAAHLQTTLLEVP